MKMFVLGILAGAMLLGTVAAKYEVPSGTTVIVIDSEWMDPYDPCDPAYDNLYTPPVKWLVANGNSLGSLIKFNVAYARTRADKNFRLISEMSKQIAKLEDPNDEEVNDGIE